LNSLNHLYLHKYRINLKPRDTIHLPSYKGSALRGIFGYALRRAVCASKSSECDDCMLRLKCVYSSIMESPVPEGHPYYRKYRSAPHPYVIVPPLTGRQYFTPDDPLFFEIVLIGKADEYLPYFVFTFTEMGRIGIGRNRGKFDVFSVEAIDSDGKRSEVFNGYTGILKASDNKIDYSHFEKAALLFPLKDEITLHLETPLRIKSDDKLARDLTFRLLISRLSERAYLLAHLYCGARLEDFESVAKDSGGVETVRSSLRWIDWERYSSRQQTKMKFGGLVGEITYRGDFKKYLPLLYLGESIHVGKNTTFGLGKYRIK